MIMCILSNRLEKRSRKKFPGRFLEMKKYKTEKISICGKKSYFYINVRPLVHNNSEQPTDGGWTQRRTNNMRATGIVRIRKVWTCHASARGKMAGEIRYI